MMVKLRENCCSIKPVEGIPVQQPHELGFSQFCDYKKINDIILYDMLELSIKF